MTHSWAICQTLSMKCPLLYHLIMEVPIDDNELTVPLTSAFCVLKLMD